MKASKLNIGVIGAGQIGGTLIRQYTKAGHNVKMTNASDLDKLKQLASETGAHAGTLKDTITDVDVIVLSIPFVQVPELPKHAFRDRHSGIPIIDTCNYYPIRDGLIKEVEEGMLESIWVSNHLQRPVIKAYNNIFAESLIYSGKPKGDPNRIALPISGDDKNAKEIVAILIDISGFDSLDYGALQESWKQQPGSPVYCTDLTLSQLQKSLAIASPKGLPEKRELGLKYILEKGHEKWMDTVLHNRTIYKSVLE